MKTLYDLLGALPDDDADQLRAAFRRAVKTSHPDSNPGDPKALLQFRKIVRANEILADPQQRAGYDRLLQIALRQQAPKSKRDTSVRRMRRLASHGLSAGLVSALSIGGYVIIQSQLGASHIPAKAIATSQSVQKQTVVQASQQVLDITGQTTRREQRDDVAATAASDPSGNSSAAVEQEAVASTEVAPDLENTNATVGANVSTTTGPVVKDAGYYRERGIAAYQNGDLQVALVDFDLAISIDPGFLDNYIDRSIVFYRLGDLRRAFADITEAKRIESAQAEQTHDQ